MYKLVFLLVVSSALLAEGLPTLGQQLVELAKSGNWGRFHSIVRQQHGNGDWPTGFNGNVEDLKPLDGTKVSGHSVSITKQWSDDGTHHTETGEGKEVINKNGEVTIRRFQI